MDLSLSIPSKMSMSGVDLKDCLKNFIAKERMEKCGYKCEKCKAVDKMEKDLLLIGASKTWPADIYLKWGVHQN